MTPVSRLGWAAAAIWRFMLRAKAMAAETHSTLIFADLREGTKALEELAVKEGFTIFVLWKNKMKIS